MVFLYVHYIAYIVRCVNIQTYSIYLKLSNVCAQIFVLLESTILFISLLLGCVLFPFVVADSHNKEDKNPQIAHQGAHRSPVGHTVYEYVADECYAKE